MESSERQIDVDKKQQAYNTEIRLPVARYMLSGIREKFNKSLFEIAKGNPDLVNDARAQFLNSPLAKLVLDSVNRLSDAEREKQDKVVLSITREDARMIIDNCKPTSDFGEIQLNTAMIEEFQGDFMRERRRMAKGFFAKVKASVRF